MDRVRVVVSSGVALLEIAVMAILNHEPEPTFNSILDEHQDCGSGGTDFAALERCLVDSYDWPQLVAERFSAAMRDREESWVPLDRPTDWDAFQRYADDLRAVYRALGLRDLADVETETYADSSVRAFTGSIDTIIGIRSTRRGGSMRWSGGGRRAGVPAVMAGAVPPRR